MSYKPSSKHYDVVIVGAGPAGIFAAKHLCEEEPNLTLLVVDKGPDVNERITGSRQSESLADRSFYISHGLGGTGLFSDGKLSLSRDVGHILDKLTSQCIPQELIEEVKRVFTEFNGEVDHLSPTGEQIKEVQRKAADAGLTHMHCLVHHLGTENYATITTRFFDYLKSMRVHFRLNTAVTSIEREHGEYTLTCKSPDEAVQVNCKFLLLAPGRAGASWLGRQAQHLGLKTIPPDPYVGVRLEVPRSVTRELAEISADPKLRWCHDSGFEVKTHCFCQGGIALAIDYGGFAVVSGHSYRNTPSSNSSFSVLCRSSEFTGSLRGIGFAAWARANFPVKPLVQRLSDLEQGVPSDEESLFSEAFKPYPSIRRGDVIAGDIRSIIPHYIVRAILDFISRLDILCPGAKDPMTLVYAPSLEWWIPTLVLDSLLMETSAAGIFAAGDGAGITQGVVAAATSGILAAKGILRKSKVTTCAVNIGVA